MWHLTKIKHNACFWIKQILLKQEHLFLHVTCITLELFCIYFELGFIFILV